ncbi:MAG: hypothetical protein JXB62_19280 [Pirellulales bacterium]|nr:hypothetical protein [Pirellulales bacterium]
MVLPRRPVSGCLALFAVLLCLAGSTPAVWAQRPSAPRLLPTKTLAVISVPSAPELAERFMNTSVGRMGQDPQLKPLIGQLYGSVLEATSQLKDEIGLSLPEILAIPQGELTVALVLPEEGDPAVVALLDAGNQLSNARKLLERATVELERQASSKKEETVAGTKLVIYEGLGPRGRKGVYFEKDNTIVLGSDPNVLKQILSAWNGGEGKTLVDNPNFAAIMQRCRGAKNERPHAFWYVDPIGIVHAVSQQNASARVALALLPVLGLDGLLGVGGSMTFDTPQFDSVMHAHLLLDNPRAGILKMIAFESGDVTPERWVPIDTASYMTLHWNVEKTYSSLATVYDGFRGEGALAKALQRRILGPTGIDLEAEVIKSLEGRVSLVVWIERPIGIQSQRSMLGFKLKDPAALEAALEKLAKLERAPLAKESFAGKQYYRVRVPQLEERPPEERPPLPCFGVLDDYLLVGNSQALYQKAVTTWADGTESLADELDYKLIASKIRRVCGSREAAMISFDRPEEIMRFLYDLVNAERTRQNLQQQAENNPFFRSVNTALNENPLPPFEVLRQYLAPGGALVIDDETGLHYTAFALRRKSE